MNWRKLVIIEAMIGVIAVILNKFSPYDIKWTILVGAALAINGIGVYFMGGFFVKRIERTKMILGKDSEEKIPKDMIFFACFIFASIIIVCLVASFQII